MRCERILPGISIDQQISHKDGQDRRPIGESDTRTGLTGRAWEGEDELRSLWSRRAFPPLVESQEAMVVSLLFRNRTFDQPPEGHPLHREGSLKGCRLPR